VRKNRQTHRQTAVKTLPPVTVVGVDVNIKLDRFCRHYLGKCPVVTYSCRNKRSFMEKGLLQRGQQLPLDSNESTQDFQKLECQQHNWRRPCTCYIRHRSRQISVEQNSLLIITQIKIDDQHKIAEVLHFPISLFNKRQRITLRLLYAMSRLSVVCLSSVCDVGAPYSGG